MPLPVPANIVFDLFRSGKVPPLDPDVAAIPGHLRPAFRWGLEAGQGLADAQQRFSHILLVATDVDIRDDYNAGVTGPNADTIFVPDSDGAAFRVVFVERRLRGSAFDHLRVSLSRAAVAWPSGNL